MRGSKVYTSEIQRAAVALQVACYEHSGVMGADKDLPEDVTLKAIEECGKEIHRLVTKYVKQERE